MELAKTMNALMHLLITLFVAFCNADYTLEIRAVKYQNKDKRDANGDCCDPGFFSCNECDVDFHFCVRQYGTSALSTSCWYSDETSDDLSDTGYISFPTTGQLYSGAGLSNPITFNRAGSWPVSFQLMVRITDSDSGSSDDLVDRVIFNRNLSPSSTWSSTITGDSYYSRATFSAQFRVQCNANYYTSSCSVYCKPRDDDQGHYDCNSSGQRVCKTGWTDPGSYCLTPICKSGCSETGGYCNAPFECICHSGWTGSLCNECIPKDGCSTDHGHCDGPFTCVCESGYGGSLCTQDADVCGHQAPCKHGATCTNTGLDSYSCNCLPGYTGTNCEENINECEPEPCKNGGGCNDLVNGYECDCVPGYTGSNCETNIDDCASSPCQNGGSCIDLVNNFKCECSPGYNGTYCEGHQCDMDTDPCENGGMCIKTNNGSGYQCDCTPGYMGTNCDSDINECLSNTTELCYNGGTCNNTQGGYNCECAPGFTGFNCSVDIDDCLTDNCSLNSVCIDGIDSYSCNCSVGYTGDLCDIEIDYCVNSPCLNNGTCNSYIGFYGCNCPDGFTGSECEINIDDCSQNLCENGGTCIDEVNAFICNCSSGFTGTVCNTTVDYCDPHPCEPDEECIVDAVTSDNFMCVICIENVCDGQGGSPYIGEPTSNTSSNASSTDDTPTSNAVSEDKDTYIMGLTVGVSVAGALLLCCLLCITVACCMCYCRKKKHDDDIYMASTYNGEVNHNPLFLSPRELLTSNSLTKSFTSSFKKSSLTRSKEHSNSTNSRPSKEADAPGYDTIKTAPGGDGERKGYSRLLFNPFHRSPNNIRSRSASPRTISPSAQGYSVLLQSEDSSCELMKDPSDDTRVSGNYSKLNDNKPTIAPLTISGKHGTTENPYVYEPPPLTSSSQPNGEEAESELNQNTVDDDDAILNNLPPPIDVDTVIYETIGTPDPIANHHYDSLPSLTDKNDTSVFNPYENIS